MPTKARAIWLMVLCTIFTSVAQVLYKFGAAKLEFNIIVLVTNVPLISGMVLYVLGAFIMISAFKGGEVSSLYPIIATSYIWVSLMSWYFFGDVLNLFRWAGVFSIIIGLVLISLGSKNEEVLKNVDVI